MAMNLDTDVDARPDLFPCQRCQSPVFDDELFCEACGTSVGGHVEPEEIGSADREERDFGVIAAVSDRGRRRWRNEDAMAIAAANGRFVAAVCDGVASTANPDQAARLAADVTLAGLEPLLHAAEWPDEHQVEERFDAAFADALSAVMTVPDEEPNGSDLSPSTTLVSVFASPGKVFVGNVGDSRAYWLGRDGGSRILSVDDSLAQESIAEGIAPEVALAHPDAHTITRWIGSDTESVSPRMVTFDVTEPGVLVLCTDGLWNYFEDPDRLRTVLGDVGSSALEMGRRLIDAALAAGGQDNVTVVVVPIGAEDNANTSEGQP